jgi:acetate kinase
MREPIFVIDAGSSSIKFSLYQTTSDRSVEAGARTHGQKFVDVRAAGSP